MPADILLLGYAGLAALAAAQQRHGRLAAMRPGTARLLGIALLALSLTAAFANYPRHQAVVAWIGLLSLSGVGLVLLLSRWRRPAMKIAVAAPCVALLLQFA